VARGSTCGGQDPFHAVREDPASPGPLKPRERLQVARMEEMLGMQDDGDGPAWRWQEGTYHKCLCRSDEVRFASVLLEPPAVRHPSEACVRGC
jgi:hypothetical protein